MVSAMITISLLYFFAQQGLLCDFSSLLGYLKFTITTDDYETNKFLQIIEEISGDPAWLPCRLTMQPVLLAPGNFVHFLAQPRGLHHSDNMT